MKLVLFMGSPRKNGNTAALAAPFLEEFGQLGVEAETVWLYDKTILPCLGCKTCQDRMDGLGCVREDDMADLFGTQRYHRSGYPHLRLVLYRTHEGADGPGGVCRHQKLRPGKRAVSAPG